MQMEMNIKPILFAGPTLADVDPALLSEFDLCPPVRRGDVSLLVETVGSPGVLIVADGIFHHFPSVGHAELKLAIERGWKVWGVSSMGAIRAAEMQDFGMNGFGRVFERFATNPDFTDDEVALLHLDGRPYTALTEPLIHVRFFLDSLTERNRINDNQRICVLNGLEPLWFGYRSLDLLSKLLRIHTGMTSDEIDVERRNFRRYRVKAHDLEGLLKERPWDK
jgi:hypothetical protein